MFAKRARPKPQQSNALANITFPFSGENVHSPISGSSASLVSVEGTAASATASASVALPVLADELLAAALACLSVRSRNSDVSKVNASALTFSTMRRRWVKASDGVSFISSARRSILFNTMQGRMRSFNALNSTACVCVHKPSKTSMTMSAPSHKRVAVDTSDEKSMWPGESTRLIKYSSGGGGGGGAAAAPSPSAPAGAPPPRRSSSWNKSEMADECIVMPRCCSSSVLSKNRILPANLGEMTPLEHTNESDKVVLPWSTCAKMQKLRMRSVCPCKFAK